MSIVLSEPTFRQLPTKVGPDTYVVHEVQHALGAPLSVFINSAVILAEEPVLVDTGSPRNRRAWLEDTFSLVDPADVRWVVISHEDSDHVGNLEDVLRSCPHATLVCNWSLVERYANAFDFPLERCRWLDDGDRFTAGDREFVLIRPPVYDSPTTRGVLDTKTGVYWAADAFATPVPGGQGAEYLATDVGELDLEFWSDGMTMFGIHALAPWVQLVDDRRFAGEVDRMNSFGLSAIISSHSPTISFNDVGAALAIMRKMPTALCPPPPDQAALDLIIAATQG